MLRTVFVFLWTVISTFFLGLLTIITFQLERNSRIPDKIARIWAKGILFVSGVNVTITGEEHIDATDITESDMIGMTSYFSTKEWEDYLLFLHWFYRNHPPRLYLTNPPQYMAEVQETYLILSQTCLVQYYYLNYQLPPTQL